MTFFSVCDVQTYGLECSLSCGNCSDRETCHHVNGTCPRGCNEGVEGEKCQTRELSPFYVHINVLYPPPPPHHFRCMYTFELKYRLHELKYHPILMAVVMFVGWGVRFVTGSLWVRDKSYLGRFKHTLHGILSAFPLYRKNIKRLVF